MSEEVISLREALNAEKIKCDLLDEQKNLLLTFIKIENELRKIK